MQLTPEQVKGRIKNVAKENKADARTLMRIYMMERFLERVANSQYKDNFIIKGGMLVTAMVGVALRSTMDIDTSIKNQNLSAEDAKRIVDDIKDIDLGDGVTFEVKDVSNIMDEMEYPGIRFTMNAVMGKLVTPMKIDISTGDVITPRAIEYNYKLLLDDRSISLWSYNLETILAEKLQTVLARGLLNTRMRDFYDIKTLLSIYEQDIDADVLKKAFEATCKKRSTENLKEEAPKIMAAVSDDAQLHTLWKSYQKKYPYVLPMAMDDLDTWKGLIVFGILMVMLFALMWKTNLYYQNPVLTVLGYEVFSFKFETTQLMEYSGKECIGITRGTVSVGHSIKRQKISDDVFLIYEDI